MGTVLCVKDEMNEWVNNSVSIFKMLCETPEGSLELRDPLSSGCANEVSEGSKIPERSITLYVLITVSFEEGNMSLYRNRKAASVAQMRQVIAIANFFSFEKLNVVLMVNRFYSINVSMTYKLRERFRKYLN